MKIQALNKARALKENFKFVTDGTFLCHGRDTPRRPPQNGFSMRFEAI